MAGAGLGLVWLHGRDIKPESAYSSSSHGDSDRGAMSVRFATFDTNWKQTSEMPIDLRVCECCPTTAAVTADGPIAAFRHRSEDEVRETVRLSAGMADEDVMSMEAMDRAARVMKIYAAFCEATGLDYVSASPYRVPIARLAAAQAALRSALAMAETKIHLSG